MIKSCSWIFGTMYKRDSFLCAAKIKEWHCSKELQHCNMGALFNLLGPDAASDVDCNNSGLRISIGLMLNFTILSKMGILQTKTYRSGLLDC